MAQCEMCGNEYDKLMEISRDGKTHLFDSLSTQHHHVRLPE